jgi:ribosomal subunit interface protein
MLPILITIRDMSDSHALALETAIHKRAEKLSHFCPRINSCRVVVKVPQKHTHQGRLYNVRIDLKVPGKELVSTYKCHEDAYVATRDAFAALSKRLEEHTHRRQGRIKNHNQLMHGHVVRILKDQGYGFIEGVDGNEYYFSLTNVSHPRFSQLLVGDAVKYLCEPLNEGWQAQHVVKEKERQRETA